MSDPRPDGVYWQVHVRQYRHSFQDSSRRIETDPTYFRFDSKESAAEFAKAFERNGVLRIIRIRPRVSLVVAVRRVLAARRAGVELWFRRVEGEPGDFHWRTSDPLGMIQIADGIRYDWSPEEEDILARYIVATPADSARIDKRRGG